MEFAKDAQGELVHAEDARTYGHYICPVCAGRVMLRRGAQRRDHFAHRKGAGRADCELYHPGSWITPNPRPSDHSRNFGHTPTIERIAAPELVLGRRSSKEEPWYLAVCYPKANTSRGHFLVKTGNERERKIYLRSLVEKPILVPVSPEADNYDAWLISGEVEQEYADALSEPVPGLRPDHMSVFSYNGYPGRKRTGYVTWGGTYVLVFENSSNDYFPDDLQVLESGRLSNEWSFATVRLPRRPNQDVGAWFASQTDVQAPRQGISFSLLPPHGLTTGLEGGYLVPADQSVTLVLSSSEDASADCEHTITAIHAETAEKLRIDASDTQCIELTIPRGKTSLLLDDDFVYEFIGADIDQSYGRPRSSELAQLTQIIVRDKEGRHRKSPLNSQQALDDLIAVRKSNADLLEIYFPIDDLRSIEVIHEDQLRRFPLTSSDCVNSPERDVSSLSDSVIREFTNAVRESDVSCCVLFEFASNGIFRGFLPAATSTKSLKLPASVRSQLLWILAQSSTLVWETAHTTVTDKQLVEKFGKAQFPTELTAHVNSLSALLQEISENNART